MSRLLHRAMLAAAVLSAAGGATPASAQNAAGACHANQDGPAFPAPASLLPRLARTFGTARNVLRGSSFVRCAGGHVLGCMVGANLSCGHADVRRQSVGGNAFCKDNPGSDVVPMAATGHDTIYEWRCAGARAVSGKPIENVDRQGFVTRNWRPLR